MELDLLSLDSVARFADAWNARLGPLHVLINNAGIFAMGGWFCCPFSYKALFFFLSVCFLLQLSMLRRFQSNTCASFTTTIITIIKFQHGGLY